MYGNIEQQVVSEESPIITTLTSPTQELAFAQIGSGVGFTIGLVLAFKNKTGFWKGWGYTILGGMALSGIGYGVGKLIKK